MEVIVDEVWSTPSTLHMRVIVFGPDRAWRHKFWPSMPLTEVPEEVIVNLYQAYLDMQPEEDHAQTALF
jgi:hypothetical protein